MNRFHLFVVCLFGLLAPASAAAEVPVATPGGVIRQGPWTLFPDRSGALHLMLGSEVLVKGIALSCGNGGYWTHDRLEEREIELGKGSVTIKGKVPGKEIRYEQRVSIDGGRIRFQLRRQGKWVDGGWESLAFLLPLARYEGSRFRAGDGDGVFPAELVVEPTYLVQNVVRFECAGGDPALNLKFESEAGMSLLDERRFGGQAYRLSIGLAPRDRVEQSAEMFLTLPQVAERDWAALRVSRIGYPVKGEKFVVLEWPRAMARPPRDEVVLKDKSGRVVKRGRFGETVDYGFMQCSFAAFDFSEIDEPGEYLLEWHGGRRGIVVGERVFTDRLWEPTLDHFIPFLMCHTDVEAGDGVPGHRRCHMDDGVRVAANFPGVDQFQSYGCEDSPHPAGGAIPCATGGWHDAGDCDLNVNAQGFSTWVLALAAEEFGVSRDRATLDADRRVFTAGRPDGTPDILQQVEWGARWLLEMLAEEGRTRVGVVGQPHLYQLPRGKTWGEATDNLPGTGDERHVYVDYHANLQLVQVTALAAAARVLADARPELAARCRQGAEQAWRWFETHEEVYRATSYFYPERKGRDGFVAAALAELYLTTNDPRHLEKIEAMTDVLRGLELGHPHVDRTGVGSFWYAPPVLARLAVVLGEGELKSVLTGLCRRAAGMQQAFASARPWPFRYWHIGTWGNTSSCVGRVFDAYWLAKVVPDALESSASVRSMLWIYGLHPLNDRVFVAGIGHPGPEHIHSGQLRGLFGSGPGTVPGALVPGISGIDPYLPENVIYYRDDGHYHNNESTIYGSVLYLFAVNALRQAGY